MKPGLSTREFADAIGLKNPKSIRTHMERKGGGYCGIIPRRMANGRLLWPTDAPARILGIETDQGIDPKAV